MRSMPDTSSRLTAGTAGLDATLLAAEQFLADTAEAVNPGTPARELLGYATRYRAHLSALAAACRDPGGNTG